MRAPASFAELSRQSRLGLTFPETTMTGPNAFAAALVQLREEGFLTDAELEDLCGDDEKLARKIRQRLIIQRLAKEDETGVGLVLVGPAESPDEADASDPESEPMENAVTAPVEEPGEPVPPRHVFLSYGRADAEPLALRLKEALEADGHAVWLDRAEIKGGRAWEEQIEQALERTDIVVAVLSPHAVRRPDGVCLDEISFARYHGLPIIPVMALLCKPPLGIYRLDWVDLQKWEQERAVYQGGLRKLRAALRLGANQPVEGEYADLFGRLSPLDFGPDLARLQRDFTGREWLQDEVRTWLAEPDGPRVFLLTGDPGAGKSAAMAYLARQLPNVAALHLCRANDAQTLDPSRFVRSLAAQLAAQIPTYASALRGVLHDPDALNVEAGSLFKNLVVNPLAAAVPDPEQTPVLVLVDGLDEAQGAADPTIPALLGSYLAEFAAYGDRVRFVLSSREMSGVLRHFGSRSRRFRIEAGAAENRTDLRAFLERVLTERTVGERLEKAKIDTKTVARWLEEKAAGNFLYAEQAVLGIREGVFDPSDPAAFPSGLVGLYQHFFARIFPDLFAYETRMRPLLDVLVAAREPLSAEGIAQALEAGGRVETAGLDPLDPTLGIQKRLKAVAGLFPEREGRYAPYHASAAEWLSGEVDDERDALGYTASLKTGHTLLARAGLNAWRSEGAALPAYHLRHLPTHLLAAERWDELYGLLTTLPYLEAKAGAGLVLDLARDFQSAHAAYPAGRPERFILRVLGRALEYETAFLLRHPECIFQVLWNRGWWYDTPQAAHLFEVQDAASGYTPPWARPGPRVHVLLEGWRARRAQRPVPRAWVRRLHPPFDLYSGGQTLLRGHTAAVNRAVWSPDGQRVASASDDKTVRVWPADAEGEPVILIGHDRRVRDLAWSPDGTRLASASDDRTVRVWAVDADGEPLVLRHEKSVSQVMWSPDSQRLASISLFENTVRVWAPDGEGEPLVLRGHEKWVSHVAWSPDGRRLASCSTDEGMVLVFHIGSQGLDHPIVLRGHDSGVNRVAWSPDRQRLAVALRDNTVRVWPSDGEGEPIVLEAPCSGGSAAEVQRGVQAGVKHVAWSPDGRRLAGASTDGILRVWWTDRTGEPLVLRGHEKRVNQVSWSPRGDRLATASLDGTVRVWWTDKVTQESDTLALRGHAGEVDHVEWSSDGQRLVSSAAGDTAVRVWRSERQGEGSEPLVPVRHEDSVTHLAWSPQGDRIATSSYDRTVGVWWASGARKVLVLRAHTDLVRYVAWSPDGQRIASASFDGTVRIWSADVEGAPVILRVWPTNARFNQYLADFDSVVQAKKVNHLAWSPAGDLLAGSCLDGDVRIWQAAGDGRPVVLRGPDMNLEAAPAILAPINIVLASMRLDERTVRDLVWSPVGRQLAGLYKDGTVRVWSPSRPDEPLVLKGAAHHLAWSPDGQFLAAHYDGRVRHMWNVTDGTELNQSMGSEIMTAEAAVGAGNSSRYVCRTTSDEVCVQRREDESIVTWFEAFYDRALSAHPLDLPVWAAASGRDVLLFALEDPEF